MRRLSSLGSRQLGHRKGRSALTALGIVLGVAILFGVLVSNATTSTGVDRLIEDFTGAADVLVTPAGSFDATMPATAVGELRRLPDVEISVGSYNLRSAIPTAGEDELHDLSLRGISRRSAEQLQEYPLAEGRWFRLGAPEVMIPQRLSRSIDVSLGDRMEVATPQGRARVTIVGILADRGAGRTAQGDVAFTSIQTTRALAEAGEVLSGVRLALAEGTDVEGWIADHRASVGPGVDLRNAESLADDFKGFLDQMGIVFTFFATITLFVGAFLIYLTLSMAVIERVRIYGTLRALGATQPQVRRTVLFEAAALGVGSTVVGLGLGLLLAKGLLAMVSGLFDIDLPGLTIGAGSLLAAILVGIVTTIVSSYLPARRAARLSPVVAMKGDYATETRLSRAWIAGGVAFILGTGLSLVGDEADFSGSLSTPLILLGAVLLTPLLLRPMARVLGRLTNRLSPGVGEVAVLHLVKERSRSAYTLALIMVVMGMIFAIGGLFTSMGQALDDTIDRQFGADLLVSSRVAAGDAFEQRLRAVPGVRAATPIRFADTELLHGGERRQMFVQIIEPDSYFDVLSFSWVDGEDRAAKRALSDGGSLLLTNDRARELGVGIGDRIRLDTASGTRRFEVAGTFTSFGGPPVIVAGIADGRAHFNAGDPNVFHVDAARGADLDEVKVVIEEDLGRTHTFTVTTAGAIKEEARSEFSQYFNIIYAILLVAAIVGILGLANTLAMSVIQRYREIGILRAIGTTRAQVWRMVLVESATLGAVAFALALPLGLLLSWLTVRSVSAGFGFDVAYVYPALWVPIIGAFGAVAAVTTAIAPGRRAAKLEVVGALQYE